MRTNLIICWDEVKHFFKTLIKRKPDLPELTELQRAMWMHLRKGDK